MKKRVANILNLLKEHYPKAHCELDYKNAYQLLIATILSAQCTDVQVNKVTKELFKKFETPKSIADAKDTDIQKMIYSTGFYKNKTKNIMACSKDLVDKYDSKVPDTMKELIKLAGVGRKTANVVLFNAFGKAEGVVVDTHVKRISTRLGLTKESDPIKIEKDLMKEFDQSEWGMLSHYLIFHGRRRCKAQKPECEDCFMKKECKFIKSKK